MSSAVSSITKSVTNTVSSAADFASSTVDVATGGLWSSATGMAGAEDYFSSGLDVAGGAYDASIGGLAGIASGATPDGIVGTAAELLGLDTGAAGQFNANVSEADYQKLLLQRQSRYLESAAAIAESQFKFSLEDREYFEEIFRPDSELDKDDPLVRQEIANRLADPQYDGTDIEKLRTDAWTDMNKSVDQLLFDSVRLASSESSALIGQWEQGAKQLGAEYIDKLEGFGDDYKQQLLTTGTAYEAAVGETLDQYETNVTKYRQDYEAQATDTAARMGTADEDIYAQQKGQLTAGISQGYKEAEQQLLSVLGRRGLAASGIEGQALTDLAVGQAQTQAGALNTAYNQAIAQSDQRRATQLGIYGQLAESGINTAGQIAGMQQGTAQNIAASQQGTAGQIYNMGVQTAGTGYGITSGIESGALNTQLAASQQNLANLNMASATSQGIYQGATNLLANAGQTYGTTAGTAGGTATSLYATTAGLEAQKYTADQEKQGALLGGAMGGIATIGGALLSDRRLKENLVKIGEKNGLSLYSWDWNDEFYDNGYEEAYNVGFIAQDVQELYPEAISVNEEGYLMVDYEKVGA